MIFKNGGWGISAYTGFLTYYGIFFPWIWLYQRSRLLLEYSDFQKWGVGHFLIHRFSYVLCGMYFSLEFNSALDHHYLIVSTEYMLLTFYYKYSTYRCLAPNFFDCMVLINVNLIFFTILMIFSAIKMFRGIILKIEEFFSKQYLYVIDQYV